MTSELQEFAGRLRSLRELSDISVEEMAEVCGVTVEEYLNCEEGKHDFPFTFIYKAAQKLGVDMADLLTGEGPRLSLMSVVRAGKGVQIKRQKGLNYFNLGYHFKDRYAEPFLVEGKYDPEADNQPIPMVYHEGQEFDYVLKGQLRVRVDQNEVVLNPGDAIYFDSGHPHGNVPTGGEDCLFLAVVIKDMENADNKE